MVDSAEHFSAGGSWEETLRLLLRLYVWRVAPRGYLVAKLLSFALSHAALSLRWDHSRLRHRSLAAWRAMNVTRVIFVTVPRLYSRRTQNSQ
jgi:hypothetical protein